jgi:hypothetical protein
MSDYNDGGPAFTAAFPTYSPNPAAQGMSLRDWFAGQALAGFLAAETQAQRDSVLKANGGNATAAMEDLRRIAGEIAYEYADAMLAARVKP